MITYQFLSEKFAERAVEIAMTALVSAAAWGLWMTTTVHSVEAKQADTEKVVTGNVSKLGEVVIEQRVTNERLNNVIDQLRTMHEDQLNEWQNRRRELELRKRD
jgi:hypothetical protein